MNAPFDIDRERMRANALRHRAFVASRSSRYTSRPFGLQSTFAVVLVVLTVLYFAWQFSR